MRLPLVATCIILPALSGCYAADQMWAGLNDATDHNLELLTVGPPKAEEPVEYAHLTGYCYSTLAQVDCYSTRQEGQESRLVGFSEPPRGKRIATSALEDSLNGLLNSHYSSRQRLIDEAKARYESRQALLNNAPAPMPKPVKKKVEDEDPLELIKIRVGDTDYSFRKPPTEADIQEVNQ